MSVRRLSSLYPSPFPAAVIHDPGTTQTPAGQTADTHPWLLVRGALVGPGGSSGCADGLGRPAFPRVCAAPHAFQPGSARSFRGTLWEPTSIQPGRWRKAGGRLRPGPPPRKPSVSAPNALGSRCACGQAPEPLCFLGLFCRQPRAPEDTRTGDRRTGVRGRARVERGAGTGAASLGFSF